MNRQASFCQGTHPIQFTLKTLLLLFVIFWLSLAAFGVAGIPITVACVTVGIWFRATGLSFGALIKFVVVLLIIPILIWLLTPRVYSSREASPAGACANKLKQIALALHCYHSDYGCFPPAFIADKGRKPMHSWRTLIFPYLEESTRYNAYDFSEPWDGPNNEKLAAMNSSVFQCLSSINSNATMTNYVAVTGPGTVWPGDNGVRIEDITDGTSNTILLVELADSDIHWMEPRDISLDEALGKHLDNKARVPTSTHYTEATYLYKSMPIAGHIAMADGSIRRLYKRPPRQDIAAMLSINGGDTVTQPDPDCPRDEYTYSTTELLRWDHVIGLPLFLIAVVWFWYRLLKKPVNSSS